MSVHRVSMTLSVTIDRPPQEVYRFAVEARNLPKWAAGLARSVKKGRTGWIVTAPDGATWTVQFAARNRCGVLDHLVTLPDGQRTFNPMRVVPNGTGSEVLFTVYRRPGMSAHEFRRDAAAVMRDLRTLQRILDY